MNLEGTRTLLDAAGHSGVRRFLFVSSIAVTYTQRPHYHYAEAKLAAESLLADSGLDYLIVRPTVVLGPGSPLLASLRRLALLPVPVIFGDGSTLVQPIHVDDLAGLLVAALELPAWNGQAISAGGPEILDIETLLLRLRRQARGSRATRPVRLPVAPVRLLLSLLEPVALPLLPFTAGQLAIFLNPGVADPHPLLARLPHPRRRLDEMLGAMP